MTVYGFIQVKRNGMEMYQKFELEKNIFKTKIEFLNSLKYLGEFDSYIKSYLKKKYYAPPPLMYWSLKQQKNG